MVFVVNDKGAVQSQIYFTVSGEVINDNNRAVSLAYDKYFSGGMSSIVFQEIREFRSLAYSSWAYYNRPWYNNNNGYFIGYVGCQADKTIEAISVFKDITLNMPLKPNRIEQTRSGLINSINSKRLHFRKFPKKVSDWIKMGYLEDPRKNQVNFFNQMSFNDIIDFQKLHIANKPTIITIVTDLKRIDMEELRKYGEIVLLKKKDILN